MSDFWEKIADTYLVLGQIDNPDAEHVKCPVFELGEWNLQPFKPIGWVDWHGVYHPLDQDDA